MTDFTLFRNRKFLTERDVYTAGLDVLVAGLKSEIGYLHRYHEDRGEIELNVWSTKVLEHCRTVHDSHYPLKDAGIWADCIRQRGPVRHNDFGDAYGNHKFELPEGHVPLYNHVSVPVFDHDNIIAIVGVGNRKGGYDEADAELLLNLSDVVYQQIQVKIGELGAYRTWQHDRFKSEKSEVIFRRLLSSISRAMELRDEYTVHHQTNVAALSTKIAKEMELSEAVIYGLEIGALLHDIGKIATPHEVLNKTGKLYPAERSLLELHPLTGADIIGDFEYPWPLRDMVLQHHERLDGSGYPLGLNGKEICLEARVLAVADTFDAMSTDRPYRPAPGKAEAIKVLKEGRNKQFDAYVVDSLLSIYEDDHTVGRLYP